MRVDSGQGAPSSETRVEPSVHHPQVFRNPLALQTISIPFELLVTTMSYES